MALLDQTQYGSILFAANKFQDVLDITDHFLAEYRKNIADNPRFVEKLKELIQSTKLKVDDLRKQGIARDEKDDYKNPDGSPIQKRDYKEYNFSGNKLGFSLLTFAGAGRMSMNKLNDIERAFKEFENKIEALANQVNKIEEEEDSELIPKEVRLKWKGTPGQFAFIVDLFINKGYLEKPTQFAERNAGIFLELFEFAEHNPTKESLGRLLHKEQDAINNPEHKGKFLKIPHRNELDK